MAHVLILGGGFGGLAAAHELRELLAAGDEVTLVDRNDRFFMGFAKLWDLAGVRALDDGTMSLERLSDRGVRYVRADIRTIDPDRRAVDTSAGRFEADALVVALGAGPAPAHSAMLAGEGAHDLYDGAALPAMHRALDGIDGGRIVIAILGVPFKCPPAPYEAALLVDERLRRQDRRDAVRITVTTPQPMTLPSAGVDASRYLASQLGERDIELRSQAPVKSVDADTKIIRFGDDSELEFSVLLGVPANVPPPVIVECGLAGGSGWIEPDRFTMRTAFERVYAVGDCTQIPTAKGQLPKAGVFAASQGTVAARNVVADLRGGEEARFDGHGYCFLELPDRRVAFVEGNFYGEPEPDVHLTDADEEHFHRKQAFERERLDLWLG